MTLLPSAAPRTAALGCLLLLAGCAASGDRRATEPHPGDPVERANRAIYAFNDGLDRAALKPAAQSYQRNVPHGVRTSVGNFFSNLGYPGTILNQLLQGKLKAAAQDTLRFSMNLTLGIGGLFDPASDAGLPRHEEDLGQTLGKWGVPPGPYLMIPFLGPATVRDLPARVADRFLEPFYWYDYGNERWFSLALDLLDTRARFLQIDPVLDRAYDRYGFIREAYLQRRLHQVYDGDVPEELLQDDATDEELEDEYQDEGAVDGAEVPPVEPEPPQPD